jgi:hypothetical protein
VSRLTLTLDCFAYDFASSTIFSIVRTAMFFNIVGPISNVEIIASGRGVRESRRLRKHYGGRRWRKLKGVATIELLDGTMCKAELHWYQAHGVGAKEFKIKHIIQTV